MKFDLFGLCGFFAMFGEVEQESVTIKQVIILNLHSRTCVSPFLAGRVIILLINPKALCGSFLLLLH